MYKKILLLLLLSSVSLFSNAQESDTFTYNNIQLCCANDTTFCIKDYCDNLLKCDITVSYDLSKSWLLITISETTKKYELDNSWIMGSYGDNNFIYIDASREGKYYKFMISKNQFQITQYNACKSDITIKYIKT